MVFNLSGLIPSTSKRNMFSAQNTPEMSLMLSWRPLSHETKHQLSQSLRKQKLISMKCKFKFGDSTEHMFWITIASSIPRQVATATRINLCGSSQVAKPHSTAQAAAPGGQGKWALQDDLAVHCRRAVRALWAVWALGFYFCRRKKCNKPAVNYYQVQSWSFLGKSRWLGYWLFASVIIPVLFLWLSLIIPNRGFWFSTWP